MNKILVGFDGSEGSKQALNRSISLIDENGELFLLAVIPIPSDKTFVDNEMSKKIENKAKKMIDEIVHDFSQQGFTITGIIEKGDPSVRIIETSNRLNVDLIVLGSKGTSKIGYYLLGSVANKVVQYAHKPVMVVR
ncbi:MAG: universal stress protein [Thermoplasmatales archaeon]|nr:MAG: universal stress protein [Thermoplasmatales archaeon]